MKQKSNVHEHIKAVTDDYECYVLVTCKKSNKDDKMEVEMSYDGPVSLASYILQGAQDVIDEHVETD